MHLTGSEGLVAIHLYGGIGKLEAALRTDVETGLSLDETPFEDRIRIFDRNVIPDKATKSLWRLMLEALADKTLILLSIAAVISLALGLYQTFGTPTDYDREGNPIPKVDWIEGVAILAAVAIVVVVTGLNDWQKELQFAKLNKKKEDRQVKVVRSAKTSYVSVYDILVGDIMILEPGDMLPADGIFLEGHKVKCDESAATGESDALKKTPIADALAAVDQQGISSKAIAKLDPFIISGSKVLEGFGKFLVTAVGPNSAHGKTMMDLRDDSDNEGTPLQNKLTVIAEMITKLGSTSSGLLFLVLLIKFLAGLPGNHDTASQKGQSFMQILITSITLIVVAVPEGLPLAVTLALAFATTRMLKDNNLVRVLKSCETMGNASTVCSDKTGTLTQNKMSVVEGSVGGVHFSSRFAPALDEDAPPPKVEKRAAKTDRVRIQEVNRHLTPSLKDALLQSIYINSTAFEDATSAEVFVGSKTETALLGFARSHLGMGALDSERSNANVVQLFPFDSAVKCMGAVAQTTTGYRLYVKGASEILLARAAAFVDTASLEKGIATEPASPAKLAEMNELITAYAEQSLRTIGLVYRDFAQWPPQGVRTAEDDPSQAVFEDVFRSMTWLALVGIMDPLRPEVPGAVKDCQMAGVVVRMVTGDNIVTARAIATECGIFDPAVGVAMEGPEFRKMDPAERDRIIPKLQVLARSSPQDKRLLVQRLKKMGETVAVTGDGTNDAPALTMADVGFSMGIAGTEVAKEASDIILMDDNFSSIVKAMMWGRAVNDAVRKFLQFQLTVNITAVFLTFISAVASADGDSVLTAVQLLWVNLIMDTFAALALATDPPTRSILNRKPARKSDGLISVTMWKMIIFQAIYQLVVTLVLHFAGTRIWGYTTTHELTQLDAMVFNTFVWMQFFNMFNNRRLDNKLNIFEGVRSNPFFIMIAAVMCGGQILIMFVGGDAFSIVRSNGAEWAVAVVAGALCVPLGMLVRCIPDAFCVRIFPTRLYNMLVRALSTLASGCAYVFRKVFLFWRKDKKNSEDDEEAVADGEMPEQVSPKI
ncbi:calcium-translocating P-type ATPase [Dipodascopsis tothii]|uniref:calcium-translocating P-type ATPase n=1 Tax=Dipodascopsis tothii TaxID=44089 RepID=UPI0034CD42DA